MEIINEITDMLSYTFMQRAFIVGLLVSICSALLGVSLVLKRYSMIGDGLGHSAFGIISVITAINTIPFIKENMPLDPLLFTIFFVIIIAFFLLKMNENKTSDSAIALISTFFLTLGIIVISFTNGINADVHNVLFGTLLALTETDVTITAILSIIVLILFTFFYNKLFTITFDETFAKATGVKVNTYKMLLALLTAITIVIGMQLIGTLLISSLLVIPAVTSIKLFKTYKSVTICSVIISTLSFIIGITTSYLANLPTGATIVATNFIIFFIFSIIEIYNNKFQKN